MNKNHKNYYYEIVRISDTKLILTGPIAGVKFLNNNEEGYKFVQVLNKKPVQVFRENEILVTKKVL
jgi:hypothetical protein